jgi:hypothetical protein
VQLAFSLNVARGASKEGMMLALPIVLLASLQTLPAAPPRAGPSAAAHGPPATSKATAKPRIKDTGASCRNVLPTEPGEIIVCAERPQGYRIDPDLMEAQRLMREHKKRPKPPDRMTDTSCQTVGPMGCRGTATIDLIGAGVALAKMADKVSKGASVGSLLVTDPQPDEYQLYLEAKRAREERQADAEAAAAVQSVSSAAE